MTASLNADSVSVIDTATVPAVTRMLLASDGSTTVLLEALVRASLAAVVDSQRTIRRSAVPVRLQSFFAAEGEAEIIERRSRLITPKKEVVSSNVVLIPSWNSGELLPPVGCPLGRHLARHGLVRRRESFGQTIGSWPLDGEQQACLSKEYFIHCRSGALIYVFELFNPRIVPVKPIERRPQPGQRGDTVVHLN